jgi:hypothetical protein
MNAEVKKITENGMEVWVAMINGKIVHRAHSEAGVRSWLLNQKKNLQSKQS